MSVRVLFVTTGLQTGGAENQLARLLSRLHGQQLEAAVVSLLSRGPVSAEVETLGIPIWHLGVKDPLRLPMAAMRLASITRQFRPVVVQGWMYHGNLAAAVARRIAARRARLSWSIRQSLYDLAREKPATRKVIQVGVRISRYTNSIVYNSQTARVQHEALGFESSVARVIDNGFDFRAFCPDSRVRRDVRRELGLPPDGLLIGLIARCHPMKNHELFLRAASLLATCMQRAHFLLAGRDVTPENPSFGSWLSHPLLAGRLHLLGERTDVPRLTAALDIASSSSSWGEAFPNSIGEAMSCGVPCVATDVGDVRRILGETGVIVPTGDEKALADAWRRLLEMPEEVRQRLGQRARDRVMKNFSLDAVAERYAALYRRELEGREA